MLDERMKEALRYAYANLDLLPEIPGDEDGFLTMVSCSIATIFDSFEDPVLTQEYIDECVLYLVDIMLENMLLDGVIEIADFDGSDFRYQLTPASREKWKMGVNPYEEDL